MKHVKETAEQPLTFDMTKCTGKVVWMDSKDFIFDVEWKITSPDLRHIAYFQNVPTDDEELDM